MAYLRSIFLFLLLLGMTACYDDFDNSMETVISEEMPEIIHTGSITAFVDNPDIDYKINGLSANVSQQLLIANDVSIDADGQTIIGFDTANIPVSLAQITTVNSEINYTKINSFSYQEDDLSSNNLQIEDVNIDLSQATYIDTNGNTTTGPITLYRATISDETLLGQMHTYVEGGVLEQLILDAEVGFMLHFADDSGQRVLPSDLNIDVQTGLELYYLDENSNRWKFFDNSQQTPDARFYLIGNSRPARLLTGRVTYEDGVVSHQPVQLNASHGKQALYTSDGGNFRIFIEEDVDGTIILTDPCGSEIDQETVGSNQTTTSIDLTSNQQYVDFNIEVIDCDGMTVRENVLQVSTGGESYYLYNTTNDGEARWLPICGNAVELSSSFIGVETSGQILDWNTEDFRQIGIISACPDHTDGYALIEIKGDRKIFTEFDVSNNDDTIEFNSDDAFKIILRGNEKMTYNESMINLKVDDENFGDQGFFVSCESSPLGCGVDFCDLTHLREEGDAYDRIYFEGTVWMQTINPASAGNFDIKGVIVQ